MKKAEKPPVVIIHFQPLELYPPVLNLLKYLSGKQEMKVLVLSTRCKKESNLNRVNSFSDNIEIKRTPAIIASSARRVFNYGFFYLYSFYLLVSRKPKAVLYFETISSWPALLYKRWKGEKVNLLVHYHEYISLDEYQHNMRLVTSMHRWESKLYPTAYRWISHTNEARLHQFIIDHQLEKTDPNKFHRMPNYPSRYWAQEKTRFGSSNKIRLVYVGSLGFDTMYLKEIIDWVILNSKTISLDIYSHNMDEPSGEYLKTINNESIKFHGACNYEKLPEVLKNYDVGLVIYKPVSENWIFNAPNKVFEYLACGLDVWFSKTMTYTISLERMDAFPKIVPVDFENLNEFDGKTAVNREGLLFKETDFYYENVYTEIYESLNN